MKRHCARCARTHAICDGYFLHLDSLLTRSSCSFSVAYKKVCIGEMTFLNNGEGNCSKREEKVQRKDYLMLKNCAIPIHCAIN